MTLRSTKSKPTSIDSYLAALPTSQRAALQKLRDTIHAAAPGAEECISYHIPTFKLKRGLVAFGAWKNHCALYPMSYAVLRAFREELSAFDVDKGTIRFTPDKPIPPALIRKIVKARLAENAEKSPRRSASKKPVNARNAGPERGPTSTSPGVTKGNPGSARAIRKHPDRGATSASDPAVTALLRDLDHPLGKEIDSVRKIILGADPSITESIKWNAPSFRTTEFFATIHLRSLDTIQVILHLGAKKRAITKPLNIPDPNGLMKWLAKDRCLVTLGKGKDIARHRKAFVEILRAWISHV